MAHNTLTTITESVSDDDVYGEDDVYGWGYNG